MAEDNQRHLWAIQAKAYAETTTITKRDVDNFLAAAGRSECSECSFRLLIATTDRIGHTAKVTLGAQEKQTSVVRLGDLEAAEVNWPTCPWPLTRPLPQRCVPDRWHRNVPALIITRRSTTWGRGSTTRIAAR